MSQKRVKTNPASTVSCGHSFRGKHDTKLASGTPLNPRIFEEKKEYNYPLYGAWIDVSSARVYNKNISRKIEKRKEKNHYENTCSEWQSEA